MNYDCAKLNWAIDMNVQENRSEQINKINIYITQN